MTYEHQDCVTKVEWWIYVFVQYIIVICNLINLYLVYKGQKSYPRHHSNLNFMSTNGNNDK